ncbi:MAG: hypothetical protein GF364_03100 [Candidatus Lokiarchaeota archaeon]|nr:hypothetical protein [Candidatus Lokiarchaeota archaeon]
MKLQETPRGQFTLTIPKAIVNAKGWKAGEDLSLEFDSKGNIVIKEK